MDALPAMRGAGSLRDVRILVTGSAGHLGEALVLTLREAGGDVVGLDRRPSAFTDAVGSITDRAFVRDCLRGVGAVVHAATLHKPHVGTHSRQAFVDTNVTGTLALLEAATAAGVAAFVYTSTTSAFGGDQGHGREPLRARPSDGGPRGPGGRGERAPPSARRPSASAAT